jgi:hypothetical protein
VLTQILEAIKACQDNGDMVRVIDGQVIALRRFMFTIAIVCNCDRDGYERRYCYEGLGDALVPFVEWDGKGHPPGDWIKLKGEYGGVHANHRQDNLHPDGSLCRWNRDDLCIDCGRHRWEEIRDNHDLYTGTESGPEHFESRTSERKGRKA